MLNGIYTTVGGMVASERRLDVISNNLANVNTDSYKKDRPVFTLYQPSDPRFPQNAVRETLYNKTINSTSRMDNIYTNFDRGTMRETHNPFDVAIGNSEAFFAIDAPMGVRYTRDGAFTINNDGLLSTREGFPVIIRNTDGELDTLSVDAVGQGGVIVAKDGGIYFDGELMGNFEMSSFDNVDKLQKQGRNLYAAIGTFPRGTTTPNIMQGFLEGSNVNPVDEMVQMIDATRSFEMYGRLVRTHDEINGKASSEIGTVQ